MLKRIIVAVSLFVIVANLAIAQAPRPDLSGTWVLDKDRSFSNPAGLDQTMTIAHKGDEVKLDAQVKTAQGEQRITESWTLDGQSREFTPTAANSKGTRTASWMPGNRGILVADDIVIETPKGTQTQHVTRKLILSADGATLTVDYYTDTPRQSYESKRVFSRQR